MKYNKIAFILLGLVFLIFGLYKRQKATDEECEILSNPSFAIGIIDVDNTTGDYLNRPGKSNRTLKFHFQANGIRYDIYYGLFKRKPDNNLKIGSKYLIAYINGSPKKCLLLFNNPIKDSTDYHKYLREFEKTGK